MSSIQSKYRSKAQKPAFIGEYPNSTGYIRAGNLTRRTSPSNNTKPLQGNTRSCRVGRDIVIMIKPEATPVLKIPSTFIPEPW